MTSIGIDIGGTNIAAARVDDDGAVEDRAKVTTPTEGPEAIADCVASLVDGFDGDVSGVGVGVPGPVHNGVVAAAPNLQGWAADTDLGAMLSDRIEATVTLGNDASVGTMGEWRSGAGRGCDDLVGLWLGTGVGGGLVADGRLIKGAGGGAGELGHLIVQPGGAMCGCGRRGCLEAYAGRASMERAVEVAVAAGRSTSLFDIRDDKGKTRLTSGVWSRAIEEGDGLATELWDRAVAALAVGVASVCNLLDCDRIVLGGGMAEKLGDSLASDLWDRARPFVLAPRPEQKVVVGTLGDDAGVVGAAFLAMDAAGTA